MTDFLDQLEDELRVAAERRRQPRRRRSAGPLKALAAVAAVALLVVGGARLAGGDDRERTASPTPTPTFIPPPEKRIAVATVGDPALLDVLSARLGGFVRLTTDRGDPTRTADPSLGDVVLYRPGAKQAAEFAGFDENMDVRPLTEADEAKLGFDVGDMDVVVVYGPGHNERILRDPDVCAPAGGSLKLCVDRSDQQRFSVFLDGDEPLAIEPLAEHGWWSWAAQSPDGGAILAQWKGYEDCTARAAVIRDGRPQALTDEASEALGWTTDGRAIVSVPADCGGERGVYLLSPDGTRERFTGPKEPSLRPLDVEG